MALQQMTLDTWLGTLFLAFIGDTFSAVQVGTKCPLKDALVIFLTFELFNLTDRVLLNGMQILLGRQFPTN